MKKLLIAFLSFSSYCAVAQSAGALDPTFNTTGIVVKDSGPLELYQDVKIQADGKIVAVGTVYDATYSADIVVARLNSDGTYDNSFGTNGIFTFGLNYETGSYQCLVKSNGKILVAGYTTDNGGNGTAMLVLQLNSDGTLDNAFGNAGVSYFDIGPREDMAYGLALQSDDKIVVCGTTVDTTTVEYNNVPIVVRFNTNGTVDNSFGTNGIARIPTTYAENDFVAIGVQPNGKIVAAGHIANGLLWFSALIARFNTDGTLDTGFGNNGIVNKNVNNVDDEFFDMQLITPQCDIVLTGFSVTQSDLYYHLLAMKYDSTGTPVASFGNNGTVVLGTESMNVGDALFLQDDGKILIAGGAGEAPPGNQDWGLWRLNADGSTDNGFGYNGRIMLDFNGQADEALGIARQSDDKIVLAGKSRNTDVDLAIARYDDKLAYTSTVNTPALKFSYYPNPVTNTLFIQGIGQMATATVYNAVGNLVATYPLADTNASIDVNGLAAGIYMVKINTGNAQAAFKFVRQ